MTWAARRDRLSRQQGEEHQYHVHAHQVPVDGEQDYHIVRCMGEGINLTLPGYRSLKSHPGPTTAAPSASQRRRSSRSAVTTRQRSSRAIDLRDDADDRVVARRGRGHHPHWHRGCAAPRPRTPSPLGDGSLSSGRAAPPPSRARPSRTSTQAAAALAGDLTLPPRAARRAPAPHGTGAARRPPGPATSRRPGRPSRWPRRPRPWRSCSRCGVSPLRSADFCMFFPT